MIYTVEYTNNSYIEYLNMVLGKTQSLNCLYNIFVLVLEMDFFLCKKQEELHLLQQAGVALHMGRE